MHNVQQGLLQLDGRAIRVLQLCGRARHEVDRIAPVPGILSAKCHDLGRDIVRDGHGGAEARVGHCDDRGTPNCTGRLAGGGGRLGVLMLRIRRQSSYNHPTTVIQPSYNHPTTILQPSYNHPTTILQPSYNHHTTILQPSYNHPTIILQPSYNRHTTILQPSYNHPTAILQPSYTPSS